MQKFLVKSFMAAALIVPFLGQAIQQDGPYYIWEKAHRKELDADEKSVSEKLVELEKKHGKKPNIIYILADDVGWGELGCYGGGKVRGTPTPVLDQMASEGMKMLSSYSEPSCTPSRIAIMTGRHPFRTGVSGVYWPGNETGLPTEEVMIPQLLSEAGYDTAMWGKWHLGEAEKYAPEKRGFDYALYTVFNGAPFIWEDNDAIYDRETIAGNGMFYDYPGSEKYKELYGIEIEGIYEGEKGKGRKEIAKVSSKNMEVLEDKSTEGIVKYIKEHANSDKPFFIYWATLTQQLASSPKQFRHKEGIDSRNNQAAQLAQHNRNLETILNTLHEEKIHENTLVVWISDNGPMYAFWPNSGYSWLKGGKGQVYEGGVRVPGIAWWPGMIEPGQDPLDLIQMTDLFTTAARLGGVTDKIPDDRVIDGIDQTALLLEGEGHSHRNYMFIYNGNDLGAMRINEMKILIKGIGGSIPELEVYNISRDPCERYGELYPYLWMVQPAQNFYNSHMAMIKKFPNRKPDTEEVKLGGPHD